ncbi:hypothetical protein PO654_19865, partial [Phytobacter diazotrophicus]|uniref:hypothetical protein n=1 Tax=Phytobacter diazotrophicus TaxID=395631 RepID=UPI002FF96DF8
RCHRQNMKTSIINGSEVSRLSVAIQAITRRRPSQIAGTLAVVGDNGVVNNIIFNNMGSINIIYTIKTGANKFTK